MSEWKLVPMRPTAEMIDAAYQTVQTQGELFSREAYRAMLDAAPVPVADDCDGVLDCYAAENQQFSDELARLRAENERLKADAARYQWLRRQATFSDERDMGPGGRWLASVFVERRPFINTLDSAIDAAMAQGKV